MTPKLGPEDEARAAVELLMRDDPDTAEVVAAMRRQWRSWCRIALCFRRQIEAAKARRANPPPQ